MRCNLQLLIFCLRLPGVRCLYKIFDVGQTDLFHLGSHVEAGRRNNLKLVHWHQKLRFGEVLVQVVARHVVGLALEAHFSRKF